MASQSGDSSSSDSWVVSLAEEDIIGEDQASMAEVLTASGTAADDEVPTSTYCRSGFAPWVPPGARIPGDRDIDDSPGPAQERGARGLHDRASLHRRLATWEEALQEAAGEERRSWPAPDHAVPLSRAYGGRLRAWSVACRAAAIRGFRITLDGLQAVGVRLRAYRHPVRLGTGEASIAGQLARAVKEVRTGQWLLAGVVAWAVVTAVAFMATVGDQPGAPASTGEREGRSVEAGSESGPQLRLARASVPQAALDRANAELRRGHSLRRAGRLQDALAAYRAALRTVPGHAPALAGVVRVHLQQGEGERALSAARQLVARQPSVFEHQELLADAYALQGDPVRAHAWRLVAQDVKAMAELGKP